METNIEKNEFDNGIGVSSIYMFGEPSDFISIDSLINYVSGSNDNTLNNSYTTVGNLINIVANGSNLGSVNAITNSLDTNLYINVIS